jgi:hypothetical protein
MAAEGKPSRLVKGNRRTPILFESEVVYVPDRERVLDGLRWWLNRPVPGEEEDGSLCSLPTEE